MTKKITWRILQTNTETNKSMYVWATYKTKKQAEKICEAFNKIKDTKVIHTVVRVEA